MDYYYSPLRYPGGKGKVSYLIQHIFASNSLNDGVYVEPYAGGASVALSLLFNEYASRVVINDIDRSIYAFWHSVLYETERLCTRIRNTPVTIESWERQNKVLKDKKNRSLLALGFATFFLNRTNRSGILDAGVIGGRQQTGKWKIDARYNKSNLIARIQRVAEYQDRITVLNLDAMQLTTSLSANLPPNSLFYFDPPYFERGKDLYLDYYQKEDHKRIAEQISKINKQKWILTYDNAKEIKTLYKDHRTKTFSLAYSAGTDHRMGTEMMVFSDNIVLDNRLKLKHFSPRDFRP